MSRGRALLLLLGLVAVLGTVIFFAVRMVNRDWDDLVDRFAHERLYQVQEAALELEGDFDEIGVDLQLALRFGETAHNKEDQERELGAMVAVVREYRTMQLRDRSGGVLAVAHGPDPIDELDPELERATAQTAARAFLQPGTIAASRPVDSPEGSWLRVFALASSTPEHVGGTAIALVVDTRPLFAKLKLLAGVSSSRVIILGPHGAPLKATDPEVANLIETVAANEAHSPTMAALIERMHRRERGIMMVSESEAQRVGVGRDHIVAAFAPIEVSGGQAWAIATLTSIDPLRTRQHGMIRRMVAALAVITVFLGGIFAVILLMARRTIALRERLRNADQLAHLHEKAEKILDNIPTGVLVLGEDGCITAINRALRERLGPEVVGGPLDRAFDPARPESIERIGRLIGEARATETVTSAYGESMRLFAEEGQYNLYAVPLEPRFPDARVLLVIEDVSMLRALETQLLRSEKLATVGVLAAGIAHEIGTPLGVVRGRAELALGKLGPDHPQADAQRIIIDQIDKVSRTIRQLLDFSRTRSVEVRSVQVAPVVETVVELLRFEAERRKVRLEIDVAANLPPITADPDGLQQVLINLVMNACDACEPGGRVRVAARLMPRAGGMRLQVEDDGRGIPEEHLNQIFDPFFTTKKRGQGTGLGLSIVSQIVRSHRARIELRSEPSCGTVVTLLWPLAASPADQESARVAG